MEESSEPFEVICELTEGTYSVETARRQNQSHRLHCFRQTSCKAHQAGASEKAGESVTDAGRQAEALVN